MSISLRATSAGTPGSPPCRLDVPADEFLPLLTTATPIPVPWLITSMLGMLSSSWSATPLIQLPAPVKFHVAVSLSSWQPAPSSTAGSAPLPLLGGQQQELSCLNHPPGLCCRQPKDTSLDFLVEISLHKTESAVPRHLLCQDVPH